MSKMNHTPEPWCTNGREIGDSPMMYTKISNSISGNSYEQAEANAARIVACVNACGGMEDPAREIAELRQAVEYWKTRAAEK